MRSHVLRIIAIGFISLSHNALSQERDSFPVQTKTENGTVEGMYDVTTGLQHYYGIPFAKPPVGDLRWRAPQPASNWTGVLSTKEFKARPVQGVVFGDMNSRSEGISEDCLYLNVWTPAKRTQAGLPVLVYFYGGGFVAGDASEPRYDGASMAKKGIVVVTVNYRLGIFGFFAHPDLSKEASYKGSGNYGLLDQTAGLKWVQKNIANFGGDPKKVTIAGESAGSISVSAHMMSPLSKGLIAGAIGESGAAINPTLAPVPLAEAEKTGLEFAQKAGYPTIAQMRALSTRDLFEIYQDSKRFGFPTVIDGYFYTKTAPEVYKAKEQAQVPLLLGWNSAEIPGFAFTQGPMTKETFIAKVKEVYPTDFEEVLKLYPHNTQQEVEWAATNLASDRFISYSTWKWFDLHRKNSSQPVYRYLYSKLRPPLKDQSLTSGFAGGTQRAQAGPPPFTPIGAPHACEIEYCMGNLDKIKEYAWTADDYTVSDTMLSYFANFILKGDPNGDKLPQWPAAEANDATPPVMIIDTVSKAEDAANDRRYVFLDKQYKNDK
jgi:para-nitrobenzyl esterase